IRYFHVTGVQTCALPIWGGRLDRPAFRSLLRHGLLLGVSLWAGYFFQTAGLRLTTASKAAFLTALGVVFVPLLGALFFHRRPAQIGRASCRATGTDCEGA